MLFYSSLTAYIS